MAGPEQAIGRPVSRVGWRRNGRTRVDHHGHGTCRQAMESPWSARGVGLLSGRRGQRSGRGGIVRHRLLAGHHAVGVLIAAPVDVQPVGTLPDKLGRVTIDPANIRHVHATPCLHGPMTSAAGRHRADRSRPARLAGRCATGPGWLGGRPSRSGRGNPAWVNAGRRTVRAPCRAEPGRARRVPRTGRAAEGSSRKAFRRR